MSLKITGLLLIVSLQVACCSQSFSYPVIAGVSKVEVMNSEHISVKEIKDTDRINKLVRFIDERRSRWCSPRFGSLPSPSATLNLYINNDGRGIIGFGDGFLVAEFSVGKFKMELTRAEEQEFLKLLGVSKEHIFSR